MWVFHAFDAISWLLNPDPELSQRARRQLSESALTVLAREYQTEEQLDADIDRLVERGYFPQIRWDWNNYFWCGNQFRK